MKTIRLVEYQRFSFKELEKLGKNYERDLRKFDENQALEQNGELIFNWSYRDHFRATNYVGIVQIPGLVVEILPKIDNELATDFNSVNYGLAQDNLLYMLSICSKIPILERELATLANKPMSLLESLIYIFVTNLENEIRRGVDRGYLYREENLGVLRGKLLISNHIKKNSILQGKVFVGFDEFCEDTMINQILKAGCQRLVSICKASANLRMLHKMLPIFENVSTMKIQNYHFDRLVYNRNTERYSKLVDFCWYILNSQSPSPSSGKTETFTFLFSMHSLFEEFIATTIKKHAAEFGFERDKVYVQAKSRKRSLLIDSHDEARRFFLKPDLLVEDDSNLTKLIIDTKWKALKSDKEDSKNGVSQSDIYQVYAYSKRYVCNNNLLLYPKITGASRKRYLIDDDLKKEINVDFIDMNRDLRRKHSDFIIDLKNILEGVDGSI